MTPQQVERLVKLGNFLRRYGLLVIIIVAAPGALVLGLAAKPEGFHPLRNFEKPGIAAIQAESGPELPAGEPIQPAPTPAFVKGIYVSAATAGYRKRFNEIIDFVDVSEVNALVIDVKDGNGRLAFNPTDESLKPYASARPDIPDLKALTAPLKEKGIYLIARIFVFQDPTFAEGRTDLALKWADGSLWRDNKGIPWLDAAAKDVWRYNVKVAKEVVDGGFDEVQFDYIRFPSDGKTSSVKYPFWDGTTPKHEVMRQFFVFIDRELRMKYGIKTSVDLFGFTMVYHDYDLNIGQLLSDALPHFDFISPMVYPSHYPNGYLGFANPADYPYEVIEQNFLKGNELIASMKAAEDAKVAEDPGYEPGRLATIRPWLQDFDLGADYDVAKIQAEMKVAGEGNASGWIFWNARNVYNEPAFQKE
jgi:hypothetical protein